MMRIAITADPELPVPPLLYGGIERVIAMLTAELTRRGHEVTLFAEQSSTAAGELVAWPGSKSTSTRSTVLNASILMREVRRRDIQIIHSFSRIAYLLPQIHTCVPKLMSYQRPISRRSVSLANLLSRGKLEFSAISGWMMESVRDIGRWHLVPNGVPLNVFPYVENPGSAPPLVFLGRLEKIKGPHLAIQIAKACNLPLVLAGNIPPEHNQWYRDMIEPHLCDQIRYIGPVDDAQKATLLGQGLALLMPILWDEPFGIVMAESMACGTPVIGMNRGAVPEVVLSGKTGFVGETVDDLIECVKKLHLISRRECRLRVESNYCEKIVADAYISVYDRMLCRASAS